MITESMLYWATRLDYIRGFSLVLCLACVVFLVAVFITRVQITRPYTEDEQHTLRSLRIAAFVGVGLWVILILSIILVPSTAEYAAIKLIPRISNSQPMQKLPEDLEKFYPLVKDYLERQLKGECK